MEVKDTIDVNTPFKYLLYEFQEKEQSSAENTKSFDFVYSFEHTPYKELEPAEQES